MAVTLNVAGVPGQTGSVTLTASASGFSNETAAVDVRQAIVGVPNNFTSLTAASGDRVFDVYVGVASTPTGTTLSNLLAVRKGASPLSITVTNSNASVGQLKLGATTGQSVIATINPGFYYQSQSGQLLFDPLAGGNTTVGATVTPLPP